jgi:hypothetical protein
MAGLALAAVVLLLLVGLGGGPTEEELPPLTGATSTNDESEPQLPRLFAADSIWNEPVAASAAIDPASRSAIGDLTSEIGREKRLGIGPWIASDLASTPLYVVPRRQPRVRVKVEDTGVIGAANLQRAFAAVPIPPDVRPAQGTDAHLVIWQPSTDRMWEFWQANKRSDGWHASWGGAMHNVTKSPGYYGAHAWPGAGANWGATASSLPLIGGVMRLSELRAGRVDHALAINIPYSRRDVFAWPAQRTDGDGPPDALPEGAHLRLDPTIDLDAYGLPRFTRIVAEAAQRYGMIVRDQTHHATSLFIEDWTPHGKSPLSGPDGLYEGSTPGELLSLFPWERLQLLKMRLCRNGERCPPPPRKS